MGHEGKTTENMDKKSKTNKYIDKKSKEKSVWQRIGTPRLHAQKLTDPHKRQPVEGQIEKTCHVAPTSEGVNSIINTATPSSQRQSHRENLEKKAVHVGPA